MLLLAVNTALTLVTPPQYVSRAKVRLTGYDPHPGSTSEAGPVVYQLVEDFADSFPSHVVISAARARLEMPDGSDADIKSRLRATPLVGSTYVIVSAWDENADAAQKLLRAILDARASFHDMSVRRRLAEKAVATDTVELKVRTELDQVSARLSESKRGVDYAGNIRAIDTALANVICDGAKLEATLASLSAMSEAAVLGDTKEEPSDVTYLESAETHRKWGVIELRQELAASRSALAGMLGDFGENNPRTAAARARVNAVEKELKSFLALQLETHRSSLASLKKSERQLRQARADCEKAILEDRAKDFADGTQRAIIGGLEASLARIVQSRQLIDLAGASASPLFVVEDPPSRPTAAERPYTRLAFLSCPLLGAIVGLLGMGPQPKSR